MKLLKIFALVCIISLISSCAKNPKIESGYLSFTLTYASGDTDDQYDFYSDIYTLNLEDSKIELRATIPYEKDYPLGVYLEEYDSIIYSGISDKTEGNQIWMRNNQTEKSEMLSEEFYHLTHFQPISSNIVLVAGVTKNAIDKEVTLHELDLETKIITPVKMQENFDVRNLSYNSEEQSVLFSGYSKKILRERIINQDVTPFVMPDNFIYSYKNKEIKEIAEVGSVEVLALFSDGDNLYYRNGYGNSKSINLTTGESSNSDIHYFQDPYFENESNKVYYVDGNSIEILNLETNGTFTIFIADKKESAINNMTFIERRYTDD